MSADEQHAAVEERESEFIRLPGLFRRWEIEQVIDVGADFHFEEAGTCCDGTPLVAVYRRDRPADQDGTAAVPAP